ncbi:Kinesin-like protein kif24 [Boothiomyces sp. JEL0866]|nr:Kinesin-like protein kif24 [Boothiomyces sp. JEL0866]
MASLFLETLRQAELDAYYSSLTAYGVRSVESLMQLTMQDYGVVGVNSMEDRKTDYAGDGGKKTAAMPIKSRFQMPKIGAATLGTSQTSIGSNSGVPTRESSHSLDDINRSSLYDRTNRSSLMDTDDDQEDSPQQFRRPVKKVLGIASSPKQNRSNLNAYGVPLTFTATTQKSQSASKNDLSDRIRVCVRKRPLSKKEAKRGDSDIAKVTGRRTITILEPKVKVDLTKYVENHEFIFDEAFDQDATNEEVYKRTALPLVEYIFEGVNESGQTGSGKTFTMLDPQNGLYVLAGRDIFSMLRQPQFAHLSAWVSFYEIYQGHLYDLLGNRKKLFAREDGKQQVIIKGIQEYEVDNVDRLMQIFESGNGTRSTGATGANSDSSRSHAIFQLVLKNKKTKKIHSKLSFIDLAGSERGADRGETDKQTRMEGSEINKSLLALKECIRALDQDSRHTPFRQSKLTQVLKDSFIGNSRTCMIATITPNMSNSEHSLNTLRYADRVKELKGSAEYDDDEEMEQLGDDEHEEFMDDDEDGLLIDEEFPNETLTDDQQMEDDSQDELHHKKPVLTHQTSRPSLLSQQKQKSPVKAPQTQPQAVEPKGMTAVPQESLIDDLIKLHRNHIRESTEFGKQETKLLVNLTMKMGKNSSDRNNMYISFDNYVRELDEIMRVKMEGLIEIRQKIQEHLDGR